MKAVQARCPRKPVQSGSLAGGIQRSIEGRAADAIRNRLSWTPLCGGSTVSGNLSISRRWRGSPGADGSRGVLADPRFRARELRRRGTLKPLVNARAPSSQGVGRNPASVIETSRRMAALDDRVLAAVKACRQ